MQAVNDNLQIMQQIRGVLPKFIGSTLLGKEVAHGNFQLLKPIVLSGLES
jgi:hypothetical protein